MTTLHDVEPYDDISPRYKAAAEASSAARKALMRPIVRKPGSVMVMINPMPVVDDDETATTTHTAQQETKTRGGTSEPWEPEAAAANARIAAARALALQNDTPTVERRSEQGVSEPWEPEAAAANARIAAARALALRNDTPKVERRSDLDVEATSELYTLAMGFANTPTAIRRTIELFESRDQAAKLVEQRNGELETWYRYAVALKHRLADLESMNLEGRLAKLEKMNKARRNFMLTDFTDAIQASERILSNELQQRDDKPVVPWAPKTGHRQTFDSATNAWRLGDTPVVTRAPELGAELMSDDGDKNGGGSRNGRGGRKRPPEHLRAPPSSRVVEQPFLMGDWKCEESGCGYHNFRANELCLKCGAMRRDRSVPSYQHAPTHEHQPPPRTTTRETGETSPPPSPQAFTPANTHLAGSKRHRDDGGGGGGGGVHRAPPSSVLYVMFPFGRCATEQELSAAMSSFGPIRFIRTLSEKSAAFVHFADTTCAEEALRSFRRRGLFNDPNIKMEFSKTKHADLMMH